MQCHRELVGHRGGVLSVRYTDTGAYCLSVGKDKTIILWNAESGNMVKRYTDAHGYVVEDASFLQGNTRFVSCGGDRDVFLWDVGSGKCIRRLKGHDKRVNAVEGMGEDIVVSASDDRTARIWDLRSSNKAPIHTLKDFGDAITCICVDSSSIVMGSVDATVRTFDIVACRQIIDHQPASVTSVSLSRDRNCLLASTLDNTIRLFDRSSGELLSSYRGHSNSSYKIRSGFSHHDAYVLSGSEDGKVYMWDIVEGNVLCELQAHSSMVTCISHHPKQAAFSTCSVDGTVKLWKY